MYSIETVVRLVKGEKKAVRMLFGTGRLTNDPPAIKEVSNGSKILRGSKDHRFSIAFPDPSLGKDEQGRLKARFYPVVAWDRTAELLANLGFKGQLIEVAARIEKQSYNNNEFEVLVIERFEVKSFKQQNKDNNGNSNGEASKAEEAVAGDIDGAIEVPLSDDDIPF